MSLAKFPQSRRLRGKSNFAAFAKAKQHYGRFIRVSTIGRDGQKVAFVVSKRILPLAVERNRLKRRLREIYRNYMKILPQNLWVMVIALPTAREAEFSALAEDFVAIFSKVASKNTGN